MVVLPQNPSTEDGRIPGCSCILSVVYVLLVRSSAPARERQTRGRTRMLPPYATVETTCLSTEVMFCTVQHRQAMLRIILQAELCLLKLETPRDPGSGQKIPAIWHGTGAYPGVFIPET